MRSDRYITPLLLGFAAVLLFLLPASTHAAMVQTGRLVSISSPISGSTSTSTAPNLYLVGGEVSVNTPLPADLLAAGGTLTVAAPIAGDAMLAGGTVDIQKPVAGSVRAVGGRVSVEDIVTNDLFLAGGIVNVSGKGNDTRIAGGTIQLSNGSNGPVVIYGADVTLGGTFNGNVEVVAADKVTLAPGTIIHGTFQYNAPQQADIPSSIVIDGGVNYIGSAAFLPTVQQAKTFATAGVLVFLLVRIIAAVVAAGLIAGIFPVFTDRMVEITFTHSLERYILLTLLGFASFIALPVLLLVLLVSFVGIGLALIIGAAYILFLLLAYVYAAVLAGAAIIRIFQKKTHVSWRGAILGVLALYVIGIIPILGFVLKVILMATAGGAMLTLFYLFAFRREPQELLDL